jgi:hypothetical protein
LEKAHLALTTSEGESWGLGPTGGPSPNALDQKSSTIKLPSIVPVNSVNQSNGISPNGRLFAHRGIIRRKLIYNQIFKLAIALLSLGR